MHLIIWYMHKGPQLREVNLAMDQPRAVCNGQLNPFSSPSPTLIIQFCPDMIWWGICWGASYNTIHIIVRVLPKHIHVIGQTSSNNHDTATCWWSHFISMGEGCGCENVRSIDARSTGIVILSGDVMHWSILMRRHRVHPKSTSRHQCHIDIDFHGWSRLRKMGNLKGYQSLGEIAPKGIDAHIYIDTLINKYRSFSELKLVFMTEHLFASGEECPSSAWVMWYTTQKD